MHEESERVILPAALMTDLVCGRPLLWHPDGTGVWCATPDNSGTWPALVRVSREGAVVARYEGLPRSMVSRFSPDGSRILFAATQLVPYTTDTTVSHLQVVETGGAAGSG